MIDPNVDARKFIKASLISIIIGALLTIIPAEIYIQVYHQKQPPLAFAILIPIVGGLTIANIVIPMLKEKGKLKPDTKE